MIRRRAALVALALLVAAPAGPLLRGAEPASDSPALAAALVEFRARRDAEAKAAYEKIVADDPKNDAAYYYLGRLAKRRKDWKEVVRCWEKCTELKPDFGQYWAVLAEAYGRRVQENVLTFAGNTKRARAALEKSVELEPDNLTFRSGLILFHVRVPGLLGGSIAKAREQAEEIRKRDAAAGWLALGKIELHERNWAEAEKDFLAAAEAKPESIEPPVALAQLLLERGRAADALARLDELLARQPDHAAALFYFAKAALVAERELERGEAALRRYLAQPQHLPTLPTHGEAWATLGDFLARRGDKTAARTAYEEALSLEAEQPLAVAGLKRLGAR